MQYSTETHTHTHKPIPVHQKSHKDWSGIKPEPRRWTDCLRMARPVSVVRCTTAWTGRPNDMERPNNGAVTRKTDL